MAAKGLSASEPSTIRPGGSQAELFNDSIFCELRAYAQVPDDCVNSGWNLTKLENGGGKGGTLMAKVGSLYIVKELSDGDHKALLKITSSYAHHVRGGETLLCPIYMHFMDVVSKRKFFVMRNGIGGGPFKELYDLKGCADDKLIEFDGRSVKAVHKRIWNVGMWLNSGSWSEERRKYYDGKMAAHSVDIVLTLEQRAKFLQSLRRDADWLATQHIMDYSLLVAVRESSKPGEFSATGGGVGVSALGQRPLLRKKPDGTEIAVYVAIIDILQLWTMGKRVARCIKCLEPNKATVPPRIYADRFCQFFEARARGVPEEMQQAAIPAAVAPPAGDCEDEGKPEERLNSRPMPDSRTNSRAMENVTSAPL